MNGEGAVLILGVGNPLLGDDGVGIHVVDEILRRAAAGAVELPPGTRVVDGGTRGLDLLPEVSDARALILVDAAQLDAPPGTVAVLDGDAIHGGREHGTAGLDEGVAELVDVARFMGRLPAAVSLVGIQPAAITVGIDLSGPVGAAIDDAVRTTVREACFADARTRSVAAGGAGPRVIVGALR
jgi:hydrogenase maturation protease